jgi:outer membrane protein TolC
MSLLKRKWLVGLILISLQAYSQQPAPGKHELSLRQCMDYAEKNSAVVKNSLLDIELQEQQNRSITSTAYPQINGSANLQYNPAIAVQTIPDFISPAVYNVLINENIKDGNGNPIQTPDAFGSFQVPFGTKWTANAGVTLSQILFDGQVFVGLQARTTSIDYRTQAAELTKQQIKTNVAKVYYQLSIAKVQVQLIDANIGRADKLLNDSRELFKNGFAEQLDIDRASVQLTNLQSQKQTALNNISNGYLGLKLLIGMPVKDTLVLTDSITGESIQEGLLNEGIFQYTDRPDYRTLSAYGKLQEYNVRRYKLARIPTASLNAAYTKLAQERQFSFFEGSPWFSSSYIGVTVNVPIFGGFAKDANIKMAQLQLQQTNNSLENLKLQIAQEVDSSINSFHSSVINLNNQQKNLELAEKVYDLTKKKYESGLASTTDISNAQADLTTAQTSYVVALFNAGLAKIDYLYATGQFK